MSLPAQPLEGIRVLDLSNLFAGPKIGMFLSDFGAEVIKAEHPKHLDELRNWGMAKDGIGLYFKVVNRNKKLITLNLSTPKGQDIVRQLTPICDVILCNYRPGTMERWGLGYEVLSEINPGLVMAAVSGYGQTGPAAHKPGFGTIAEAYAGFAYVNGHEDREPLLPPFGLGDASTAIFGAFGVMLALYHRDARRGKGQFIDLSLYDGMLTMMGPLVINYDQLGNVQERTGNKQSLVAPRSTYRTADDRWIAISGATQATFKRTARALGIPEIAEDPRFTSSHLRIENVEALDETLQAAIAKLTRADVLTRLEEAGAAAGPVNSIKEIMEETQIEVRGSITTVEDEELGKVRMQTPVPRLGGTPGTIRHTGSKPGTHNGEIYRNFLDFTDEQLEELRQEGVI